MPIIDPHDKQSGIIDPFGKQNSLSQGTDISNGMLSDYINKLRSAPGDIYNSPTMQMGLGAVQGIVNPLLHLRSLLQPAINAVNPLPESMRPFSESDIPKSVDLTNNGIAGKLGNFAGNIALTTPLGALKYADVLPGLENAIKTKGWINAATSGAGIGTLLSGEDNTANAAGIGAGLNLATHGLGELIAPSLNALKGTLSKYAAGGLTKNVAEDLKSANDISNHQAFEQASNNFKQYNDNEKQAWQDLQNKALDADIGKNINYNDSNYTNALKEKLQNLQSESSRQSSLAAKNNESQNLLSNWVGDTHNSFTDALEHNKSLNAAYENEQTPGKSPPFSTIKYAIKNLKDNLQDNIQKNGLQDSLGTSLDNANNATKIKNQIFGDITSLRGRPQDSSFVAFTNLKSPYNNPGDFVNDYIPKSSTDGIGKMQQFTDMLGDSDMARKVLKMNYFKPVYTGEQLNPTAFLKKYNNLSDEQQNFLFNDADQKTVDALNKINVAHPDAFSKNSTLSTMWHHSFPALLGMGVAHMAGVPWTEGAVGGVLGGQALSTALKNIMQTPAMQSRAINFLTNTPKESKGYLQALSKFLPATIAGQFNSR
jgi:hypothetical protein